MEQLADGENKYLFMSFNSGGNFCPSACPASAIVAVWTNAEIYWISILVPSKSNLKRTSINPALLRTRRSFGLSFV